MVHGTTTDVIYFFNINVNMTNTLYITLMTVYPDHNQNNVM